jgi:ribose-phosphate pyrophosphokinase
MQKLNFIQPQHSDIAFTQHVFSDGQPHLKMDVGTINIEQPCMIITRLSQPADLLLLLYAQQALRHAGVEKISVGISYLMAARMDRVMNSGEPFSLKVVAGILNAARFHRITVFDPHSSVSLALLDNAFSIDTTQFVGDVLTHFFARHPEMAAKDCCLVAPDAGALKKVYALALAHGNLEVVTCSKERNPENGALSGFKVFADSLVGKTCIIADDICDGGGTFTGIAAELRKLGASQVILAVSHGIFSKGFGLMHVDAIYTTNSYQEFSELPAQVTVFPVLNYF